MTNKWKPYRHHYPDMWGDLIRGVNPPRPFKIQTIPAPPIKIDPLPGQFRRGGKIWDKFDPDFPPIRIRRTIPRPPRPVPRRTPNDWYELQPGDRFARTTPPPGSLRWMAQGLG